MTGRVTPQREAMVRLRVKAPRGRARTVKVAVDTGFTESLALPRRTIASLGLPPRGLRKAILADGTETTLPVYWAVVQWQGVDRLVPAFGIGGGALLGMGLLEGSLLSVHVVENGPVRIEPVTPP